MATQEMAFKSLICEESKLTFLTVEGWTVVDHLGMDLHLEEQEINRLKYFLDSTQTIITFFIQRKIEKFSRFNAN